MNFNNYDNYSPWIHTTNQCNMSCGYCYQKESKTTMSSEVYEQLLDSAEASKKYWQFRLAGGEPLLVEKQWGPYIDRMRKLGSVALLTNGLLLTAKTAKELGGKMDLCVSIDADGPKRLQSYHEDIAPYINTIMTTFASNTLEVEDLANYVGRHGIDWTITIDYWYKDDLDKIKRAIDVLTSTLFEHNYNLTRVCLQNCSLISTSVCLAGQNMFAIDPNGNLYTCQTTIGNQDYFMGNISDKTYRPNPQIITCDCSLFKCGCSGGCPTNKNNLCEVYSYFINRLLEKYYAEPLPM